MVNAVGVDGPHRQGDEEANVSSLSASIPLMYGNDSERQLLFDQVTKMNGITCSLTTSLRTSYKGRNAGTGIMFSIRPSKNIEILTLELPTYENFANGSNPSETRKVKVYFRQGDFSQVMNNPSAWTLLADTTAQLVSPLPAADSSSTGLDLGVIVPANEFKSKSLQAGELYSIYVAGEAASADAKETLLKLKEADGLVGEVSSDDNEIEIRTGVRLKGSPFPMIFTDPADFNGVLHYRAEKSCSDNALFATTDVELFFVVNKDPNNQVMGSIRTAVDETIEDWLFTDEVLNNFSGEYELRKEGIGMHFRGRDEQNCPKYFSECNLISATVTFKHSRNLDQGLLEQEILRHHEELDRTVSSYVNPLETSYAGAPLAKAEFAITLTGVPSGQEMNDVQKRYFEDVTVNFLRNTVETKIFDAVIDGGAPEILVTQDGEAPARNLARTPMLRATRFLQDDSGKLLVITEIAAEGSVPELRNVVSEGIGNNLEKYTMDLISHRLRPTEINEEEFGDFFAGLTSVQVKPHVRKNGNNGPGSLDGDDGNSGSGRFSGGNKQIWVIVCILLIIFSFFYICYRIYMDCFYSPFEKPMKLEKRKQKQEQKRERKKQKDKKKDKKKEKKSKKNKNKKKVVDEFKDEGSPENGGSSFIESLKMPSLPGGSSHSPSTTDSSKTDDKMQIRLSSHHSKTQTDEMKNRRSSHHKAGSKSRSKSLSSTNRSSSRKSSHSNRSSSKKSHRDENNETKSFADDEDDMSLSSADEESDDDSENESTPLKKQRKSPASSSGPNRGRLTAAKSMPIKKRPNSYQKKTTTDIPVSSSSSRSRSPSGPKRGRLTATKSMPVHKGDEQNPTPKTPRESLTRLTSTVTPRRSANSDATPRQSNGPSRGKLTPSRSLPSSARRGVQRSKSFDLMERRKALESKLATKKRSPSTKDTNPTNPVLPRRLDTRSSHTPSKKLSGHSNHSDSKKLDRQSWHPDSKKLDRSSTYSYSKKLEPRSSHSNSKKKPPSDRTRGIKASKSMPMRKTRIESDSNKIWLTEMCHDTSDSDLSDSSDDEIVTSSRKPYTKRGKNGRLADVEE